MSQLLKQIRVSDLLRAHVTSRSLPRPTQGFPGTCPTIVGGYIYTLRTIMHYNKKLAGPGQDTSQDHPTLYEVNLAKYWPWTIWPPSFTHRTIAIGGVFAAKAQATSHVVSLVALKAKISQEWDLTSTQSQDNIRTTPFSQK